MQNEKIVFTSVLGLIMAATAHAVAGPIYEGFNYPTGAGLNGQSGGTGFSNVWAATSDYDIGSGSLSFGNLAISGNHVGFTENNLAVSEATRSVLFSGFGADGTTAWLSFLIRPDSNPTSGFFTFSIPNMTIGKGSTADGNFYEVGAGASALVSTVPIVQDTTAFVVAEFQFNSDPTANDIATVFIDPTPGLAAPNVLGLVKSNVNFDSAIGAIFLDAGNGMAFSFDELRIGGTFDDVAPVANSNPVPVPSTLVMSSILLGIFGMVWSKVRLRRTATAA